MYPSVWRRRDQSSAGQLPTNHVDMKLITPPATEPVPLHLLKQHARISFPDADELLEFYAAAARDRVERFLRRALITQTWDITLDWGPAWIELPKPPIQSIVSVSTTGLDNVEVVVPTQIYITNLEHALVGLNIGQVWPLHRGKAGFRIQYTCGYGSTPADVPFEIRHQIMALTAMYYEDRSLVDGSDLPSGVSAALRPYRVEGEPFRMAKGMSREDLLA